LAVCSLIKCLNMYKIDMKIIIDPKTLEGSAEEYPNGIKGLIKAGARIKVKNNFNSNLLGKGRFLLRVRIFEN
jgi:hypothetical protein